MRILSSTQRMTILDLWKWEASWIATRMQRCREANIYVSKAAFETQESEAAPVQTSMGLRSEG